jgi:Uma2 family endonuclease
MAHRDSDPRTRRLTVEEYLRREARARVRHEYVAGFVYAMTGATIRHNRIVRNVATRLHAAAGAGPCEVFVNDVKVRVGDDRFYYPDVLVNGVPVDDDDVYVGDPCLVVEVTSPSTRATDRREKLVAYQTLDALRTYLVVDHRRRRVEVHARDGSGAWGRAEVAGQGVVAVPRPTAELTLDEIYAGVALPTVGERAAQYAARGDAV